MVHPATLLILCIAVGGSAAPAMACRMRSPIRLSDISYADHVIEGRVSPYVVVRDQEVRRRHRELLARTPGRSKEQRAREEKIDDFIGDYARFTILVDRVLKGKPAQRMTATGANSTFALPKTLPGGPFLIALRDPAAAAPPLRGPSATVAPNRAPILPTILQAPCADAFIFPAASVKAATIRSMLKQRRRS